jgi:hypothetical protein
MARAIENLPESRTFFHAGRPIVIAGLVEQWPGRAVAWTVVSEHRQFQAMALVAGQLEQIVQELLSTRYHRIEAYADTQPLAWWRGADWWLRKMKFNREGVLSRFTEDGRDQAIYARVRHDG